ncbi:MAG: hypothetical protein QM645_13195 [Asticcacaulis sp.]
MTELRFSGTCSAELIDSFLPLLNKFEDNIRTPDIVLDDIDAILIYLQLLSTDHMISNGGALTESFSRSKKYKELMRSVNIMPNEWSDASHSGKISILSQTIIRAITLIPKKYLSDQNKLSLTDAIMSAESHMISAQEKPAAPDDTHPEPQAS